VANAAGTQTSYMILGPWDADPDKNILSYNSKLAQALIGKRIGESVHFREEIFKILSISSYFGAS